MVIKEALLQFNRITEKPFVEILNDNGTFRKKNVEIGISDGINVEITDGVEETDKIKVWNKASEENNEDDEEDNDSYSNQYNNETPTPTYFYILYNHSNGSEKMDFKRMCRLRFEK